MTKKHSETKNKIDRVAIFYTHLHADDLKDRDVFLWATHDIEGSFTGRVDILTSGLHRFFLEASKLVRNSIKLYEEGIFDSAFYSIRSALELARIVTYFSNIGDIRSNEIFKNWMTGGKFPFDSEIRKQLKESADVYGEVHQVLIDFFNQQETQLRQNQKYIHKQGYRTFYERGFTNEEREKNRRERISIDFHHFVKNALTEIALLRLCIDPFPILLRDERAKYKIHFQTMTEAFGDDFVYKVIGKDKVELYCSTDFYKTHLEYFGDNEELSEEAHMLVNNQFYDRKFWSIIQTQLHLLSRKDFVAVEVFNLSKKIANIYMMGGWHWYFSDVHSSRTTTGFDSRDLLKVKESKLNKNIEYDAAYLTYFNASDEKELWIEHNKPLTKTEIAKITKVAEALN